MKECVVFKYHSKNAGLNSGDACKGRPWVGEGVVVKRGKVWSIVMTRFEINAGGIGTSGNKTESRSIYMYILTHYINFLNIFGNRAHVYDRTKCIIANYLGHFAAA